MTKSKNWKPPGGLDAFLDSAATSPCGLQGAIENAAAARGDATNRMLMEWYDTLNEVVDVQLGGRILRMRSSLLISHRLVDAARKGKPDAIAKIERWAGLIRDFQDLTEGPKKEFIVVWYTGEAEPKWKDLEELNVLLDAGLVACKASERSELLPLHRRRSANRMFVELHDALGQDVTVRKSGHVEKMPTSKMISHQLTDAARRGESNAIAQMERWLILIRKIDADVVKATKKLVIVCATGADRRA